MNGDVGSFQCNGILCPVGMYSSIGRAGSGATCQTCSSGTNGYFGSFECLTGSESQERSERDILETLYNAMDGPNWIDNTNWLDPDVSICDWFGIQCVSDTQNSVSSIVLSNNRLTGTFPRDVYDLPNLAELNVQGNDIVFSFNGIGGATNLESLNLEEIGLTSLMGISQATSLKLLRVDGNNFPTFPTDVFDLTTLEVLSLSDNLFAEQPIPSDLQYLTAMTYFSCGGCGFTGEIPNWFRLMPNLQYLKLSQNALTGTVPAILESMASLKHLDLSDQSSSGKGLSGNLPSFSNQTALTEVFLSHNNFQGPIPTDFLSSVQKTELVTIDVRYNALTGTVPGTLANFNKLNLYVTANNMDSIPQSLCSKNWNDGDVADYGCDGIACAKGTFNSFGRATDGVTCFQCDDPLLGEYIGTNFCGTAVERQALVYLYRSYEGPNWKSDNNWLKTDDHCSWEGITCWATGEFQGLVQKIELSDNNLQGSMPFALLWQMVGLSHVDLSKNAITVPFSMIGNAVNLETIILSETATSSLEGLEEAVNLKSLHLTSAAVNGTIPQQIFSLLLLEELYMSHNDLTGEIPFQIGDLKELKDLYLFGNKLEGTIPIEIGYLARLEHLSLGGNKLEGTVPRQLTSLPLLEFLSLENEAGEPSDSFASPGTGLSGPLPALDGFPSIRELYMAHNSFTGTIPEHFLQGIHDKSEKITVDLSFNRIEGSIPASISNFQDMNLLLAGNEISNIPDTVCSSLGWMNGEVANGCDAILCPPGSFNSDGRRVDSKTPCEPCTYPGSARTYGSTSCGPGSAASMDDRSILFDLYDATGGSSWTTSSGWRSENNMPFCDWHGVKCEVVNGAPHVTELDLSSNNLNGIVPSVVFHLPELRKLDVRNNPVSVTFLGIEAASNLEELYLDETLVNSLDGVGKAPKLKILHVYKNSFGWQSIPDELFDVTTLTDLNLSDSMIGGKLSGKVGQLTNLQRLTLVGNGLGGELPSELGQLNALKELEISDNNWVGTLPRSWSGMTSLEALFLVNSKGETGGITGSLIPFSTMPNLRELHLAENHITGTIPAQFLSGISDTTSLINVRLDHNELVGTVPASLVAFSKLNIDLTDNMFVAIGDGLCSQSQWNDGNVGKYSCDAILCPAGQYSPSGRQTSANDACQACPGAESSPYFGITSCASITMQREREILKKLFEATNGNGWKITDGWTDDNANVCTWYGIECQEDSSVESIFLGSNHLVGSVPKEIFELSNLKTLSLYSNPVEFSFDGIGQASNLETLSLDSTKLGSLNGIGSGLSLVEVDVRFNQLSGPIPQELLSLTNLESFTASVNGFTGTIPDFSALRRLNTLRLSDNSLTGMLPSFARQANIKALDLSSNQLQGTVPDNFLAASAAVESLFLDLSNNMLTGTVPGKLNQFTDVTIYLRDNQFSGIDPALCTQEDWNQGDVGSFQCDGILCPAGTYSVIGRASKSGSTCESCSLNSYFGGSTCGGKSSSSAESVFQSGVSSMFLIVATTIMAVLAL